MSRYTGPACRLCRREGTKLFLKGTRCLTEKCAVERRAYAPGQHGNTGGRVKKMSEYAKQLREKQKVKRMYGLTETQFRTTFTKASHLPGVKGTNLLVATGRSPNVAGLNLEAAGIKYDKRGIQVNKGLDFDLCIDDLAFVR